jgi:phosphoserine phosphatase
MADTWVRSHETPGPKEVRTYRDGIDANGQHQSMGLTRRAWIQRTAGILGCAGMASAQAHDPLPSWNPGPARQAILDFVRATTDRRNPHFVPPEDRIAAFDQDGTTWVEHPIYSQILFAYDRLCEIAPRHPEWKTTQPFQSVLAGDKAAMAKFTPRDIEAIAMATHTGMTVEAFRNIVQRWMASARHPRFHQPYPKMVYQPMLEVMRYLRANSYRTYIVTGGGQEFVRAYAHPVYGIPPEQIVGSALETRYTYDDTGRAILVREPKLLLNDNFSGKPEDVYLFTGKRPRAAFGNSTGDRQMLEYAQAGGGASLVQLVLHDDARREYAYGPAQGLPDTRIGTFPQALYDEARARGWKVISMKNDWKGIFSGR